MKTLSTKKIKSLPIKEQVEYIYDLTGSDENLVSDKYKSILLEFKHILKAILVVNRNELSKNTGPNGRLINEDKYKNIVVNKVVNILDSLSPNQIITLKINNSEPKKSLKDSISFGFC
jgi:hypothetical protein